MKITKVSFNRKFNLGNYESLDAGMEAEIADTDNPLEVLTILKDNVEMWHIDQTRKKPVENGEGTQPSTLTPSPKPSPTPTLLDKYPPELQKHLTFKDGKLYSEYTSRDIWTQINSIAKDNGYTWVSEGKDSHWERKA